MSSNVYQTLEQRLTTVRMAPYFSASSGDQDATLNLYAWNVKVSAALFADLSITEVVLRNALDTALRNKYQHGAFPRPWYEQVRLSPLGRAQVDQAVKFATGPTQNDVVAQLGFGFWKSLVSRTYQTTIWPVVRHCFLDDPDRQQARRDGVYSLVDQLAFLRNRIAHHEPIFRRDLGRQHDILLDLTGSICQVTRVWVEEQSDVPTLLTVKPHIV